MAHYSTDFPRYLTVVARAMDAAGVGMHHFDVKAAWMGRRSVESLVAGAVADRSRRIEKRTGLWDGMTVAQIVAQLKQEEAALAA
jgi:hypothetical protein